MSANYPSDLTDAQWQVLRPLMPLPNKLGRPQIDRRAIIDAILYVVRTGCQWRQLRVGFPKWKTVHTAFRHWRLSGLWKRLYDTLRSRLRHATGKKRTPPVAIVDSQSVRTAEGGEESGHDADKKITGRKRRPAVDTQGLVWVVIVHDAEWQDHDGACLALMRLRAPCRGLRVVFVDGAYARNQLPDWVRATFGWLLQTVPRPVHVQGFVVLPKRWIVERTFACLARYRRHAKDHERKPETNGALIDSAMIDLMSRRLTCTSSMRRHVLSGMTRL